MHRAAVVGDRAHLDEPRDAVVAMHDEVARRELEHERLARGVAAGGAARTARRCGDRAARRLCASTERRRLMAPNSSASV